MPTRLSKEALYVQLAEECCELGQAAAKMARILKGENWTPVEYEECRANIIEEYTDICLVADTIGIDMDRKMFEAKNQRWKERLDEHFNDAFDEKFEYELQKIGVNTFEIIVETNDNKIGIDFKKFQKALIEKINANIIDEQAIYISIMNNDLISWGIVMFDIPSRINFSQRVNLDRIIRDCCETIKC